MATDMGKVVIKILQGSAVTQAVLGANYRSPSCKFLIVYMPKIMKVGWQWAKYCNNKQAYFFGPLDQS